MYEAGHRALVCFLSLRVGEFAAPATGPAPIFGTGRPWGRISVCTHPRFAGKVHSSCLDSRVLCSEYRVPSGFAEPDGRFYRTKRPVVIAVVTLLPMFS